MRSPGEAIGDHMSSCEKCWRDAQREEFMGADTGIYRELIARRNGIIERRCTPEEQAGEGAGTCPECHRKTLHQHTGECMSPVCKVKPVA